MIIICFLLYQAAANALPYFESHKKCYYSIKTLLSCLFNKKQTKCFTTPLQIICRKQNVQMVKCISHDYIKRCYKYFYLEAEIGLY